ncbi:MAG: hypothetical protein LV479_03160 [Methylacidiphilales bacterium]|nr:hypothetical protein [Candidatus Methylacidiphilales bacterium]
MTPLSDGYYRQQLRCFRIVMGDVRRKGSTVKSIRMRYAALDLWQSERLSRREHGKVVALAEQFGVTPQAVYKTLWRFDQTQNIGLEKSEGASIT